MIIHDPTCRHDGFKLCRKCAGWSRILGGLLLNLLVTKTQSYCLKFILSCMEFMFKICPTIIYSIRFFSCWSEKGNFKLYHRSTLKLVTVVSDVSTIGLIRAIKTIYRAYAFKHWVYKSKHPQSLPVGCVLEQDTLPNSAVSITTKTSFSRG